MTTNFPTSIDALTNPISTDGLNSPDHAAQHANANDAIEALEAKVGVNSSAVTTSHDYKLSGVTGSDKAVSKTGTETLTNKTLTSPKITAGSMSKGDMLQLSNADGTLAPLTASTSGDIISWNSTTSQWEAIANPSASDASPTVKGVVELATQAEADAGTASGSTSALLVPANSTVRARLLNTGVVDTGSATAYAIAPAPVITAYATYQEFTFKAVNANTTTTPTLAVNGLTAKTITNSDGSGLKVGQIPANSIVKVVYDGTNFQLVSNTNTGLSFKNTSATKDAADASATQNIAHSQGVIPKSVTITAIYTSATASAQNISETSYDGTTQSSASAYGTANNKATSQSFRIGEGTAGSDYSTGVVTMDATNVIITWTKTGSPTGVHNLIVRTVA